MNVVSVFKGKGAASGFRKEHSAISLMGIFFRSSVHGIRGLPAMWRKRKKMIRRRKSSELVALLKKHQIPLKELTLVD